MRCSFLGRDRGLQIEDSTQQVTELQRELALAGGTVGYTRGKGEGAHRNACTCGTRMEWSGYDAWKQSLGPGSDLSIAFALIWNIRG